MLIKRRIIYIIVIILLASYVVANTVCAYELKINPVLLKIMPDFKLFLNPEFLYTDIIISVNSESVNLIYLDIKFPADMLSVKDIDLSQSFCSIVLFDQIDNLNGEYRLICGSDNAIKDGDYKVARLKFNKLSTGWAKLSFGDDTQILAHNGYGTNLPINTEIHNISIIK